MQEIRFTYHENDLNSLIKKEIDLLEKVEEYCESTNKLIECNYKISTSDKIVFTLEVNIKKL